MNSCATKTTGKTSTLNRRPSLSDAIEPIHIQIANMSDSTSVSATYAARPKRRIHARSRPKKNKPHGNDAKKVFRGDDEMKIHAKGAKVTKARNPKSRPGKANEVSAPEPAPIANANQFDSRTSRLGDSAC